MYNEFLEKGGIYDDEAWQDYVTEVGERILQHTPHAGRNYTFVVQDASFVNAFATKDAYIFVSRGILSYFNSEDELAAVLGHEIGHVVGQHHRRRSTAKGLGTILGWLGFIGTSSASIKDLADTLTATATANYGRKYELESDAYGAEWLGKAGYDPQAMLKVIQALRDNDLFSKNVLGQPSLYHGIFGSHPEHQKRLHDVRRQIGYTMPETLSETERDYWQMLDGLVYGDQAAGGVVKDGTYYHGGLRVVIDFPEGWEARTTRSEVIGRSPAPADETITISRRPVPEEETTAEAYIKDTLKRDDVENGEVFVVGDIPAYEGDIKVLSGNAQKRKIGLLFTATAVYLFRGEVGTNGDPEAFEEKFRKTIESFRGMTAKDLKEANSQTIVVVEAKPGDTYESLARGGALSRHAAETLRVLNGHYPNGEPRAGDLVKVIR